MKSCYVKQNKRTKLLTLLNTFFNSIDILFSIDKSNVDFLPDDANSTD